MHSATPASGDPAQGATSTMGAAPAAPAVSVTTTRPLDSTAIAAARAAAYLPATGTASARAHTPNTSERQQDFGGITDMELYPIAYRDISALVDVGGLSPDAIHDWFVRYRKSKGKTMDVPPLALRASWNAFVRLWNEGRIREKVERWEASQRKYSLSTLREEVHRLAKIRRRVCLADVLEGCRECASTGVSRATRAEWDDEVRYGLDEDLQEAVGISGPVTLIRTLGITGMSKLVAGRDRVASLLPATIGLHARLDRIESFLIPDVERKADEIGDQQIEMETELDATTRSVSALTRRLQSLEQSHEAFREEIRAWRRDRALTEEPARERQRSDAGSCREDDGRARREDPPQGPPPAGIA
ncbi:hypothetical protein P43SY_006372 [Pythium insidiosum]|uniref:Uncharacterized protein n=1 Tax=Pythium insidiosum TaxID=114742 RepID=A0AAD5LRW9_PYTIN|nr:hypothetical protein P43SY_006372 [Pythium insidiosum]